jgi:hypothetical protein
LDGVQRWLADLPNGGEELFGLGRGGKGAPDYGGYLLSLQGLGEGGDRRNREESEESVELVRCVGQELAIPRQHRLRLIKGPECGACKYRADRVKPEPEVRDDTEIAAPTPHGPEQFRILIVVGGD